jgi:hypothetical protein
MADDRGRSEDPRLAAARYRTDRDSGGTDDENPSDERPADSGTGHAGTPTAHDRVLYVETVIQQAIRRGEFDDLPGAGKPIEGLGATNDPDWWIRRKIRTEQLTGLDLERDQLWQRPDTNPVRPLSKRSPADESEHADEHGTEAAQKADHKAHLEDQGLLDPHVESLRAALRNPARSAAEPHPQGESLPMRLHAALKATLQGEAGALHKVREPLFKLD